MFRDKDNHVSSTKVMSFVGFFAFLITSCFVLWLHPEKFNFELYAVLTGGGAVGSRILDKWLNINSGKEKPS